MKRRILSLLSMCALVAGVTACHSSKSTTPTSPTATTEVKTSADLPADGSTLKAEPAGTVSPINDQKMTSPVVILTASPASLQFPSVTAVSLGYRFQVFSAAGTLLDNALVSGTTYQVTSVLVPNTRHTWRVRPEVQGEGGPWSATASFISEDPAIINDPLTNGVTIGRQIGGRFIAGEGWQSLSLTDAIAWDVPQCITCKLEFDATNFGAQEGLTFQKDLKWVSMGDGNAFGDFNAFRNHPWKMHLVQRADFPTGIEIIWRNGGADPNGGDPGDHRIKLTSSPIVFRSTSVYHFTLNWGIYGYSIAINGIPVLEEGWDHWYELAPLHIELGCRPRAESFVGAIYRNIKLTK